MVRQRHGDVFHSISGRSSVPAERPSQMSGSIYSFLVGSPIFRSVPHEQVQEIVGFFMETRFSAGALILKQGGQSEAIYFLRSGRLVVRVHAADRIETVAYLEPPQVFGELSVLTGRPCVADVEATTDADVIYLPKEALSKLPKHREEILRGLMLTIAGRLQDTVARGAKAPESPIVLLRNHPRWEAPESFARELTASLARQTGRETLVVNIGSGGNSDIRSMAGNFASLDYPEGDGLRAGLSTKIGEWARRFEIVILNVAQSSGTAAAAIQDLTNCQGDLLGPGDPAPEDSGPRRFAVQSAAAPSLATLDGGHQLIQDAARSESAFRSGERVTPRFLRTVDSIARWIAGIQVGLALGGGAAWGFSHVGVLDVLEREGLPVDVISGSSMGSVIGALRASGRTIQDLRDIGDYWRNRTRRFVEWRFWRMCLLNEKFVFKVFGRYFDDLAVNRTEIPFWANAVDIHVGEEYWIQRGTLVDCIRASIALPGLLPPFPVDSRLLVDAGIMDPVPVHLARGMGCQFAIAVNVMAGMAAQDVRRSYPFNAFEIMMRCAQVMGHEIGQARAEQAADVLFSPDLSNIHMLQFARCREIMDRGEKAALANLPAIQEGYKRLKTRAFIRPVQEKI
jgi:NTE family protein